MGVVALFHSSEGLGGLPELLPWENGSAQHPRKPRQPHASPTYHVEMLTANTRDPRKQPRSSLLQCQVDLVGSPPSFLLLARPPVLGTPSTGPALGLDVKDIFCGWATTEESGARGEATPVL